MVTPFPQPGRRLEQAYRELDLTTDGTPEQKQILGDPRLLPRPWDPDTLSTPLRTELWAWLEEFVTWLNHEHVWDIDGVVPACWPQHPHLVRELAVLADQRRRGTHHTTSDGLEDWHRYALPAFTDRMRAHTRAGCEEGHQAWPVRSRHARHIAPTARANRQAMFDQDTVAPARVGHTESNARQSHRLHVVDDIQVDPVTGELLD